MSDCLKTTQTRIVTALTESILRRIDAVEDAGGVTRRSVEELVGAADSGLFQLLLQAGREKRVWGYLFNRSTGLRMDWTPTTTDAAHVEEAVRWLDGTCTPLETGVVLTSTTEPVAVQKAGVGPLALLGAAVAGLWLWGRK